MDPNTPNPVEEQLGSQQAAGLDDSLLARLESAADGSLLELSVLELQFEAELRGIRPRTLRPSLLDGLESKAEKVPFPVESRVLPFPGHQAVRTTKQRNWLPVAAAVALLGAISALLIEPRTQPATADGSPVPAPSLGSPADPSKVVPAEFSRNFSAAEDAGIIWSDNHQPSRVLKVVYTERVTMKREDGTSYQVEQPRVEYYLVPTDSH